MSRNGIDFRAMIDRLFPPKYDFPKMLHEQACTALKGVDRLLDWMKSDGSINDDELMRIDMALDDSRHRMENALLEAFTTPFDRRDIYSIAHQIGEVSDFVVSTQTEMKVLGVTADEPLIRMTETLRTGMARFSDALCDVQDDPVKAERLIREIRKAEHEIESIYIEALAKVMSKEDAIEALRRREIYHHMKDASRALGLAVDILHRIIVSIV